jgi:beta-glucosidase
MQQLTFPEGFLWGAATSSHQIEGGLTNNWSEWEQKNAKRLARESERHFGHLPNWPAIQAQAQDPANYVSGRACDHYNRFEEDFDIARSLGHTAHRFSLEWSRIEPEEGRFDEEAIEHYRKVLRALRQRGMEPFVTLWHWTHAPWIERQGGFKDKKFPERFARYARKVMESLGNEADFWITLNEPDVVASHAYQLGVWPPQEKSLFAFVSAMRNLAETHRQAYAAMKDVRPEAQVGVAKHQVTFEVARPTLVNRILKRTAHYFWNEWFLDRIRDRQDFIGLNHYNRNVVDNGFGKNPNERLTDMGWEFFPESIYQALVELKPYGKPIYVTENGLADAGDRLRREFIPRALAAVHRAIADGADVRGYLYWSLLDNFEWDKGFWPRFGLIEVDYATRKRTVRPSALEYAKICESNVLER